MEEYKEQIDRLIKLANKDDVMLNGSVEHAAVVVERMFANANRKMRILSRRLDPAIYGEEELVQQLQSFATKSGTCVEVLVEDTSPKRLSIHDFAKTAAVYPNVTIRKMPEELASEIGFNFSVMDEKGYRFEENKDLPNAVVSFGDIEFSQSLAKYFDRLWNISDEVDYGVPSASD